MTKSTYISVASLAQRPGVLITLEGMDGTGKTTQSNLLAEFLNQQGYDVVHTKEPGSPHNRGCMTIRQAVLAPESGLVPKAELLLMLADRAQHVEEVIFPALQRGAIVLSDRFRDSTMAYQGYGREMNPDLIAQLNDMACSGLVPDMTLFFFGDVDQCLKRIQGREVLDDFEKEDLEFHQRVNQGFKNCYNARRDLPDVETVHVNAKLEIQMIADYISQRVLMFLKERNLPLPENSQ